MSALSIAASAAFFSVRGIGILFSGAYISAMVMASTLEIGKLMSVSFLYRYWNKTNRLLKAYLIIAVLVLVLITSLGIYGFLTYAFSSSSAQYGIFTQQVATVETQKKYYQDEVDRNTKRVAMLNDIRRGQEERLNNSDASLISTNRTVSVTQIKRIQDNTLASIKQADLDIKECQKQISANIEKIREFDLKVLDLKTSSKHSKDMITFQFVADSFNLPLNTVVKWFTLMIIFVFDPLAVGLVLAYNVAVYGQTHRSEIEETEEVKKKAVTVVDDKKKAVIQPPIEKITTIESKSPDIEIREPLKETEQIVPDPIPVELPPIIEEKVEEKVVPTEKAVELIEPVKKKNEETVTIKPFSQMSDGEKKGLTYEQIQASIEAERNKLRPQEYFNAPTRTL